jgi:hypothetical protein
LLLLLLLSLLFFTITIIIITIITIIIIIIIIYLFIIIPKNEFNAFKEQQQALNEIFKERIHSIDAKVQSFKPQTEEYNENFNTANQIQSIRNELVVFEEKIRDLEALNQAKNANVILIFELIKINIKIINKTILNLFLCMTNRNVASIITRIH